MRFMNEMIYTLTCPKRWRNRVFANLNVPCPPNIKMASFRRVGVWILSFLVVLIILKSYLDAYNPLNMKCDLDSLQFMQKNILNRSSDQFEEDIECGCQRVVLASKGKRRHVFNTIQKKHGESTCSNTATLRGPGQQVVSYSIFGKYPSEYYNGLAQQAAMVEKFYPGWVIRIYHGGNHTRQSPKLTSDLRAWMCNLTCTYPHVDFCNVEQLPGLGNLSDTFGMVWRFAVIGDPLVTRYVFRDSDASILQREVDAVNQWIRHGTCFHLMRDHPYHDSRIMGGMWGGCNTWNLAEVVAARNCILINSRRRGDDQSTAVFHMLPVIKRNVTEHDSYSCWYFPTSLPFPTQRVNKTFVGNKHFNTNNVETITVECPVQCRPKEHPGWKMC